MPVTDKEKEVMEITVKLWNEFMQLEEFHPDDINDFRFHLHSLQNIILMRSAYRELKQSNENTNNHPN